MEHAGGTAELEIVIGSGGTRALLIVEAGTRERAAELAAYLAASPCEVRPIATGPVVAGALRMPDGADDALEAIMAHLRARYAFSLCEPGFTPSMCRVAVQLARDAEGQVHPLPVCSGCGATDPFPSELRLQVAGRTLIARFCSRCLTAAQTMGDCSQPIALCRALLASAGEGFAPWASAHIEELSPGGGTLRFRAVGPDLSALQPAAAQP